MKKLIILVTILWSAVQSHAQFSGQAGKGQTPPSIGHFYGKIVSDSLDKPLEGVSIVLLNAKYDTVTKKKKDVLVKGLTTKSNGEFSFDELPMFGSYKLKISAVGYKNIEKPVSFQMNMGGGASARPGGDPSQAMAQMSNMLNGIDRDLGNIKMSIDAKQLAVVTVTASKPTLKLDIDKKVYNVEKDIVNAGGTALDVMKNVPSVSVDIDGNVTLRNSTPQIYIEGRPTTLTLDQIPADAIESVEVITNPSAKYDASGGGSGILNISLNKNRKTGYNGNLRAGVDKYGAVNGGGDFNVRQGKFNVGISSFVNQNKGRTTGTTNRTNFGDTASDIQQENFDKNKGAFIFGRLGVDYFMTNRTTISLSGVRVHGEFNPTQLLNTNTDTLYDTGTKSIFSQRNSTTNRQFNANGLQFGVKHLFPKEGETLTADLNYFSGKSENNALYVTDFYSDGPGSTITGQEQQKVLGNGTNKFLTVQTDFVKPFTAKTKLEAGLRMQRQELLNVNDNYFYDSVSKEFILSPAASTNYQNVNNVYAAYVSVTSGIKNFGYQLGLRAERSDYTGELLGTKESFGNKYPISLFPSAFLSQKLAKNNELQLSYTRRINRPNFFQLIPFTDYTDPLNITRGNPKLVPEFTNSRKEFFLYEDPAEE